MNLKLTNEERNIEKVLDENNKQEKVLTVKEERQRTGRYIAILVGILLFLLAMYHAWVRKIPVIASLVVPAIIMFVYVGWVLYTASRDKHRALDLEAALQAAADAEAEDNADTTSSVFVISQTEEYIQKDLTEIPTADVKGSPKLGGDFRVQPIILVNDEPPDDIDQTDLPIVNVTFENYKNRDKFRELPTKRYKRRFCRSKRNAVFKRSYSIA